MTGRKEKLDRWAKLSSSAAIPRHRGPGQPLRMRAFQDGKNRVALISSAGGTGISLHAGNDVANRQKRFMITLQIGWSADKALQVLGHCTARIRRSPRSTRSWFRPGGRAALRLDHHAAHRFLGALTGVRGTPRRDRIGQRRQHRKRGRRAGGEFILRRALRDIPVPGTGLTGMQVFTDMRVSKLDPTNSPSRARPPDVPKLMNRLLRSIPTCRTRPTSITSTSSTPRSNTPCQGTLDTGVKRSPARVPREESTRRRDPKTGAETLYYPVDAKLKLKRVSPEDLDERME